MRNKNIYRIVALLILISGIGMVIYAFTNDIRNKNKDQKDIKPFPTGVAIVGMVATIFGLIAFIILFVIPDRRHDIRFIDDGYTPINDMMSLNESNLENDIQNEINQLNMRTAAINEEIRRLG